MEKKKNFKDMGLSDQALKMIEKKGFEEPTPIQQEIIPRLLKNDRDLIGQAQTGTGKTAAFGLPILENINAGKNYVQALVLAPTRELAIQVSDELNSIKSKKDVHIIPIYGGQSIEHQFRHLKKGVHIVVGTPGRVIDHLIHRKSLFLDKIDYFILDEADKMLDMGFIDDIKKIAEQANPNRRTLLFSATMPKPIIKLAEKYMKNYEMIKTQTEQITPDLTDQIYFEVNSSDKFEALCRIIDIEKDFYGLIFCRTKINVKSLTQKLKERGYDVDCLHGDILQNLREKILKRFRRKEINILVATDVAARGLDIYELTHVINYSLPQDPNSYVHRIGRTGRAGRQGTAVTFITSSEYRKLVFIKKQIGTQIRREKVPEVKDIINAKHTAIMHSIQEIIKNDTFQDNMKLAKRIMENANPHKVVASILHYFLQDEIDKTQYEKISPLNIDTTGKSRLFVAKGKNDGFTPKKLIDFIQKKAKIKNNDLQNIEVCEKFSFVTAGFREAEMILEAFKSKKRGQRSVIVKAKHSKKKSGKGKINKKK